MDFQEWTSPCKKRGQETCNYIFGNIPTAPIALPAMVPVQYLSRQFTYHKMCSASAITEQAKMVL